MAVLAPAIWRVRPGGSNTNGGGYDGTSYPGGTDYSQQNSAQATGTTGASTASTTFTDAGGAFTAAMVGNALWLASATGTPAVGAYFITAVGSATSITLDRVSGTYTLAHYAVGGGWADFVANTTSSGPVVGGNTVFILGAGTPNPAAYSPDYTVNAAWSPVSSALGVGSGGTITFANDPSTPGYKAWPDTTGGMPLVKVTFHGTWCSTSGFNMLGVWFFGASLMVAGDAMFTASTGSPVSFKGCVFDQVGIDIHVVTGGAGYSFFGCEVFSSSGVGGTNYALDSLSATNLIDSCNIHDCFGSGIFITSGSTIVVNSIIAKCGNHGIATSTQTSGMTIIKNCTIDGNVGNGIFLFPGALDVPFCQILNNIISNHASGGSFGINVFNGTTASNDAQKVMIDYNVFYNNSADLNAISYGPHDTHGGSNPYVGQSTENYQLA